MNHVCRRSLACYNCQETHRRSVAWCIHSSLVLSPRMCNDATTKDTHKRFSANKSRRNSNNNYSVIFSTQRWSNTRQTHTQWTLWNVLWQSCSCQRMYKQNHRNSAVDMESNGIFGEIIYTNSQTNTMAARRTSCKFATQEQKEDAIHTNIKRHSS